MEASEFSILKVSRGGVLVDMHAPGTQFTCFTGTKVQIPTPEELLLQRGQLKNFIGSHEFTCFTSTKVQTLTPELLLKRRQRKNLRAAVTRVYLLY